MKRWERRGFNTLHAVVAVTGVLYFAMKYLMETDDPFAVVNHPWQSETLAAHLLAAPLFVAFFGMLFRSHVAPNLAVEGAPLRWSGWVSLVSFAAMALSGYLIQIGSSPEAVSVFVWLHIGTSCVFLVGYGVHLVLDIRFHRQRA